MRTDIRKAPADAIKPPSGFIFLARRLNRHRYHLIPKGGHAESVCGVEDESMEQTMPYLLADHADKRCQDCLALAAKSGTVKDRADG